MIGPPLRYLAPLGYGALLVYLSLFPLTGWRLPEVEPWRLFLDAGYLSRTDLVANLLAYLPLGWLAARPMRARGWVPSVALAAVLASLLSLGLEYSQAFLPNRVPSVADWGLNSLGAFAGAALGDPTSRWARLERRSPARFFQETPRTAAGLAALGVWAACQLFPFVPALDLGSLRHGLGPLWHAAIELRPPSGPGVASYGLAVFGLCVVAAAVLRPGYRRGYLVGLFFAAVLAAKVGIAGRLLSLEAVVGALLGWIGFLLLRGSRSGGVLAALAIASGFAVDALRPAAGDLASDFHWIPFRSYGQGDPLAAMSDILGGSWPFLALAFLAMGWGGARPARMALAGGLAVMLGTLALEAAQLGVPGRVADVTDVAIAGLAWTAPWIYAGAGSRTPRSDRLGRSNQEATE